MKKLLLILICIVGMNAYAQTERLRKADNYYNHLAYAYAVEQYEKLIDTELDNTAMRSKLAESYLQLGDYNKAIEYYSHIVELPEATATDYYNYAYALRMSGNYVESDRWMQKYTKLKPADSRSKLFLRNKDYRAKIEDIEPYFAIKKADFNTSSSDFGGYLNPTKDKVYFNSARRRNPVVEHEWTWNQKRFLDIFYTNVDENGKAGKVKRVKKVATKFHEGPLAITPDGKSVFFTRNNIAPGKQRKDPNKIQNLKIYIADIDSKGRFVNEREFPHNSTNYSVGHPTLSKDGKTMYFVSDKEGGFGGSDIYKASVDGTSVGEMINLGPNINTEGKEMFPYVDEQDRLFFSSNGRPGLGGMDVYVIELKNGTNGKVLNVGTPINSRFDDFAFTLSADTKKGFVSSNRAGNDDIYLTEQIRDLNFGVTVRGTVMDKKGEIIPLATVELRDKDNKVINTITSDENGNYTFEVDHDKDYVLVGNKPKYFEGKNKFNTNTSEGEVVADLVLEKDPGLSIHGVVTDAKTKELLEGVEVYLVDNFTDKAKKIITPVTGDFREALHNKKLNERGSYNIVLKKDGYFTKTVNYNILFDKEGTYKINEAIDLSMEPLVEELSEMVKLNPINFDLAKYNIRPDAAVELDKIVEIMNRYPHMVVELGAHTDCRGTAKSNMTLSHKRAVSSAEYIKKRITNPERIVGKGYGESRLLNHCDCEGSKVTPCSEEEHAKNRRTEFRVLSTGNDKLKVEKPTIDSF